MTLSSPKPTFLAVYTKKTLIDLAQAHLDAETVSALQALLQTPARLYEITHLKREPRDFTPREINDEVRRGQQIRDLYQVARQPDTAATAIVVTGSCDPANHRTGCRNPASTSDRTPESARL